MSERFRQVVPLSVDYVDGGYDVFKNAGDALEIGSYLIDVATARKLRDWLTSALPCEHADKRQRFLPNGVPAALTDKPYICAACGEHLARNCP